MRVSERRKILSTMECQIPVNMPGILSLLELITEHFSTLHTHLKVQTDWDLVLAKQPTSNTPNTRGRPRPRDIFNCIFRKGSQALVTVLLFDHQGATCYHHIIFIPSKTNHFTKSKIHDLSIYWRLT